MRKSNVPKDQLPLLCAHCGGPTRELRSAERVLIRCAVCGKRLYSYYVDPNRRDETPPEQEDAFFIKRAERDLVNTVSPPAQTLYDFIRRFVHRHGYPPTFAEMRGALGWLSVSTVSPYLRQLIDAGLIEQDYATARGIRLLFAA